MAIGLDTIFLNNTIENYIIAISVLLLFWASGHLFSHIIVGIIRKLASKTKTTLDDILINILEKPMIFAIFVIGFRSASSFIDLGYRGYEILQNIMTILVVMNVVWVINRLIDVLMNQYLAPLTSKGKSSSKLDDQLLPFVRKFLKVVVVIIGFLFLLRNMGYDITSLVAGLGIGGLAFALAAQPLLSNLFGGLAIIADKPFKIGDRIRVDQKHEGYVREIGMRSTTIKTPTDSLIKIPNNIIATTVVENLSAAGEKTEDNGVRFTMDLDLEYDTTADKIEEAIAIVKDTLCGHKNVINHGDEKPGVSFSEFRDSSLGIVATYAIYPPNVIGKTRTEINLEIKKKFEKAHIKFAYPTQTLYLKQEHHHLKTHK
ncbi:MAG TPA: mechanosensitive ion channel family protein [Alphaproteobacteria bacterium]|nr:mechanosensitive ion channel family protein [Alphaproteobacteria bacterium]